MESLVGFLLVIIALILSSMIFHNTVIMIDELVKKPQCDMMRKFMMHTVDRLRAYFDDRFGELEELWKQKKSSGK